MLSGLGGDADDAGDVSEYDGDGVLGVGGGCHIQHGGVWKRGEYWFGW